MLKLADTSLILINPSPSNVKSLTCYCRLQAKVISFFDLEFLKNADDTKWQRQIVLEFYGILHRKADRFAFLKGTLCTEIIGLDNI